MYAFPNKDCTLQLYFNPFPFGFEESLDLGSLVPDAAVNSVVADKVFLAVAGQCSFGDAEQLAHILVVKEPVPIQRMLYLFLNSEALFDVVETIHGLFEHLFQPKPIQIRTHTSLHLRRNPGRPPGAGSREHDTSPNRENTGIGKGCIAGY